MTIGNNRTEQFFSLSSFSNVVAAQQAPAKEKNWKAKAFLTNTLPVPHFHLIGNGDRRVLSLGSGVDLL